VVISTDELDRGHFVQFHMPILASAGWAAHIGRLFPSRDAVAWGNTRPPHGPTLFDHFAHSDTAIYLRMLSSC
jgi:hypothetical protein